MTPIVRAINITTSNRDGDFLPIDDQLLRPPGLPATAWIGLVLGVAGATACAVFAGMGLGLFFGGIIFAALFVPPLCLVEERLSARLLIGAGAVDGIAAIWLIAVFSSAVTFLQWLLCYAILIVWSVALVGLSSLSARIIRRTPIPASAVVIMLALLWLSWPVWLAQASVIHPALVEWLTPPHPLLAINAVLRNLGIWSERPIAYRYLLALGQDVPYKLPQTILPMALCHLLIGSAALVVSRAAGRR